MEEPAVEPPKPVLTPQEEMVTVLLDRMAYLAKGMGVVIETKVQTGFSTPDHIGTVIEGVREVVQTAAAILKAYGVDPSVLVRQAPQPKSGLILPNGD